MSLIVPNVSLSNDLPYETGTWTPSVVGLTIGDGSVGGQYIRIGTKAFCQGRIQWGTTTTLSGTVVVQGFPYVGTLMDTYIHGLLRTPSTTFQAASMRGGPLRISTDGSQLTATNPVTLASGDFIRVDCIIEIT